MSQINAFQRVFDLYRRIAITGAPQTGKTTLAVTHRDRPVFHSDDVKHLAWSDASAELARRVNDQEGDLIVEGVAVPRALRKGMRVDAVILLTQPKAEQSKGQLAMGRGVMTVLREWRQANPGTPIYVEPHPDEERIGRMLDAGEDLGDVEV